MRIWGRVAVGGFAVLTSTFLLAVSAEAAPSHPGGLADTCPEVLAGAPTGGVHKVTEPPDGSEVRRGDLVVVTLRWDPAIFTGAFLHKALDCVTVDGAPADELAVQERDTANDGSFETRFAVPDDLVDGTRLCDRGFVSGPGSADRFERQKSNDVCFTVSGDAPTGPAPAVSPLETAPPELVASPPFATPEVAAGAGPLPETRLPQTGNGETPSPTSVDVNGAGRGTPGELVGPEASVLGEQRSVLPRTGSTVGVPIRLAMVALLLGGFCLLASRRLAGFGNVERLACKS